MANFTQDDLAFTGYFQTVENNKNTNSNDKIEKDYIDKSNELEVVLFCNDFLKKYNVPRTKASFQKAESLLQHPEIEFQVHKESVLDWIASNWVKL